MRKWLFEAHRCEVKCTENNQIDKLVLSLHINIHQVEEPQQLYFFWRYLMPDECGSTHLTILRGHHEAYSNLPIVVGTLLKIVFMPLGLPCLCKEINFFPFCSNCYCSFSLFKRAKLQQRPAVEQDTQGGRLGHWDMDRLMLPHLANSRLPSSLRNWSLAMEYMLPATCLLSWLWDFHASVWGETLLTFAHHIFRWTNFDLCYSWSPLVLLGINYS